MFIVLYDSRSGYFKALDHLSEYTETQMEAMCLTDAGTSSTPTVRIRNAWASEDISHVIGILIQINYSPMKKSTGPSVVFMKPRRAIALKV